MSKSIKVSEEVYDQLERLRQKRETFSDVVKKLVICRRRLVETYYIIEHPESRAERLARAESPGGPE